MNTQFYRDKHTKSCVAQVYMVPFVTIIPTGSQVCGTSCGVSLSICPVKAKYRHQHAVIKTYRLPLLPSVRHLYDVQTWCLMHCLLKFFILAFL